MEYCNKVEIDYQIFQLAPGEWSSAEILERAGKNPEAYSLYQLGFGCVSFVHPNSLVSIKGGERFATQVNPGVSA